MHNSKRQFLRSAGGLSLAAGSAAVKHLGSPFAASLAGMAAIAAQSSAVASAGSDYRALVCLFMAGGNDSHNWVVPVDSTGYADYAQARSSLALPRTGLAALSKAPSQDAGRQFALPRELDPLRDLYEQGQVAIAANVGPLLQPTTKAQFQAGTSLPPKLFSHNDQQSYWQALGPEGARSGWGGRIGDALMSANNAPVFTTVSAAGNAIFLSGANAVQYQVGTTGAIGIGALNSRSTLGSTSMGEVMRRTQFEAASHPLQAEYARVVKRSSDAYDLLTGAMRNVSALTIPSGLTQLSGGQTMALDQVPLAKQLRSVAQMISAAQNLGLRRQVFMVSVGGFDTHANQLRDHPGLMAAVAQSISYFMGALRGLGMADKVTLFTASDFGRTLTSNGSGSDHGWGSHHFVAGGAVKGGNIYGRFPVTALGGPDDIGSGRLLPGASVTEYAATLARWMGVSEANLPVVLPNIGNFGGAGLSFL